jgi:hypothetical protein
MKGRKENRGGHNKAKLAGRRFGLLTVLRSVGTDNHGGLIWECRCKCGEKHRAISHQLLNGDVKSCGCLPCGLTKHGHARKNNYSKTYRSWAAMIQRCCNPNNPQYRWYGGANPSVTVCARWQGKDGFKNFLFDMNVKPADKTLSRFADSGPYKKSNCAWQTWAEQGIGRQRKFALKKAA